MSSWPTTQYDEEPLPSFYPKPSWFEALLPISAIPLIALLLLIFPIFILAAESLFAPVYDFVMSLLMPVNAGIEYTSLPLLLILKIVLFCIFTFTGVTLLLLKINCLYTEVWSYFFQAPSQQHVPYHPDQQESMVALFNWNVFRWYRILGPSLGWTALTILIAFLGYWVFNAFTYFSFFTFQLQFTLGFFILSVLGLFTALSWVKSFWAIFTTLLGDVAAITEPEKATQILYERARKLAFGSPWVFLLYPLYAVYYLAVIIAIIALLSVYDISDLLSLHADFGKLFLFEVLIFALLILLNSMKFMAYHDALTRFYHGHSPQRLSTM